MHNFNLAGMDGVYRPNDGEHVMRGGSFLDINEEMVRDAVAIHCEDFVSLLQGGFDGLLCLTTV